MTRRTAIAAAVAAWSLAAVVAAQDAKNPSKSAAPDAAAHKQWMADAGDIQEDLREAIGAKVASKASDAAGKLERILKQTEGYWAAKHADDAAKVARSSQTLARQVGAWAKTGRFEAAHDAFAKLSAQCNACHELHPEKR